MMTDKDIKDYCKNCDVEPPAMRLKCPECEHNSDKEIFAKDIYVPGKEQIIIDGVDVSECAFHYQNKEDKHKCFKGDVVSICDGDCSYGAIYLKEQLSRKTQECDELEEEQNKIKKFLGISHKTIMQRLEELHERSDKYKDRILDLEERITRHADEIEEYCSRLADKEQECEELKSEGFTREELITIQEKDIDRYRKALDAIKSIVSSTLDCGEWIGQGDNKMENILDIINKTEE